MALFSRLRNVCHPFLKRVIYLNGRITEKKRDRRRERGKKGEMEVKQKRGKKKRQQEKIFICGFTQTAGTQTG